MPINYVAAALPEAQQKLCAKHRFDARPPSHLQSYTEQKCPHVSKEFTPEIRSILRPSAARENSLDGHLHQHSSACTVSDTDALTVGTLQPRQVLSSHVTHHQQQQQQHLVPVRTEANILPVASTSHFHLHTDTEQQGYQPTWSSTLPSIVLISMPGSGWASGIILNKQGFILTNAHVIQPRHSGSTASEMSQSPCPDPPFNVRVGSPQSGGFRWHNASVVYVFQQVLDIAVICLSSCQPDELHPAQLMTKPASAGQAIAVMGHALFSPDCQMAPSVTAGNVTQVRTHKQWQSCSDRDVLSQHGTGQPV